MPGWAWYFLKDAVLLGGLFVFGIGRLEWKTTSVMYRPFFLPLLAAVAWTVLEVFNPDHRSIALGLLGLRAYWLWWVSPVVIATALRPQGSRRTAVWVLVAFTLIVTALAAVQFGLPGDSALNRYAWEGADSVAGVADTGRVRVISTFSYLTGFTDFVVVAAPLLLALGLAERTGRLRIVCLAAAGAIAVTVPMSGSRGPVIVLAAAALVVFWSLGAFATKRGLILGIALAVFASLPFLVAPDAVTGVESRFRGEDTRSRVGEARMVLPVFAIMELEYPAFGIGTGMMQNAREALSVRTRWDVESEPGRYLVELGIVGYLLVWIARLGLLIALVRAYRLFRGHGNRAMAGLALTLAGLTFLGNLTFDHVFQAFYFVAFGFVLREAALVLGARNASASAAHRRSLRA